MTRTLANPCWDTDTATSSEAAPPADALSRNVVAELGAVRTTDVVPSLFVTRRLVSRDASLESPRRRKRTS